jgi:FKBP-type peptidyl-prolyl cis-trans isomerase FkpA
MRWGGVAESYLAGFQHRTGRADVLESATIVRKRKGSATETNANLTVMRAFWLALPALLMTACSSSSGPEAFLAKAAAEPGAVKTPSGLVYLELRPGTGANPKLTDVVKVHYRGTLTDGKEFDSSYARNEPISFPLTQVIPCWREGVQKMKVGAKAKLTCPSSIAYGEAGAPPDIPGGATLVFEVELLGIGA